MGWNPFEDAKRIITAPGAFLGETAEANKWFQGSTDGKDPFKVASEADKPPAEPTEEQRTVDLRKKLAGEAADFRANLPKYKQQQYTVSANTGRDEMQKQLRQIRNAANSRGMFFSGLRAGAEGDARTRMAAILAQQKADINREADDLATAKEEQAAQVGLAGFGDAQQRAQSAYQLALQNEIARRQGFESLGKGVGYGFGAYYGSKDK